MSFKGRNSSKSNAKLNVVNSSQGAVKSTRSEAFLEKLIDKIDFGEWYNAQWSSENTTPAKPDSIDSLKRHAHAIHEKLVFQFTNGG